jgi:hypothetical protein
MVSGQTAWTGPRTQLQLHEPATQGARRGEWDVGEMLGEDDTDQVGAPVGVFPTQRLRLQEDGIVRQA